MSDIVFKPWVGANYAKKNIFGKRILILGESHYQWDKKIPLWPGLTTHCIRGQLNGTYTKQFWTNIAIAFLNRHPSLEDKVQFWNSVSYYNFVQANVGMGARRRPTEEMWQKSHFPFMMTLRKLKPDCIISLGYDLWNRLSPLGMKGPLVRGAEQRHTRKFSLGGKDFALAFGIRHPSAGFSGLAWHGPIRQAIRLS
jgi:hypothetical protein